MLIIYDLKNHLERSDENRREPVYLKAHHIVSGLNFKMGELLEIL